MQAVETLCEKSYKILILFIGIPLFLLGLIFRVSPVMILGNFWILVGVVCKIKSIYDKRKLERLKKEGIPYDGTVVKIYPMQKGKYKLHVPAKVECLYKTEKGDNLVESGYHLLLYNDRGEDLQAKLYIDPNDAKKYAIELFRKAH